MRKLIVGCLPLLLLVAGFIVLFGSNYLFERAYGQAGPTVLSPVSNTFTQTTTATLAAIPANPSRKQIQICGQTATNTLTVTFGTVVTPTATLGIPIAAQTCTTFSAPTGTPAASYLGSQINLIAVTGSVVVLYTEYF